MSNQQLERLAKYISSKIEGEPSRQNEGTADCAIRLLKQYENVVSNFEREIERLEEQAKSTENLLRGCGYVIIWSSEDDERPRLRGHGVSHYPSREDDNA